MQGGQERRASSSPHRSATPCLGLPSGVWSARERSRLPQPPGPWIPDRPRRTKPGAGRGVRRGALGPRKLAHRWAPYRVSVPGAGPGLPGDSCPGDAAGWSPSGGRVRASERRRGARGGLKAGPRRGAGEWGIGGGARPWAGRLSEAGRPRGRGGARARRRAGTVAKFS